MADQQSILAVLNPAAGGGRCGKQAPEAIRRLEVSGVRCDVVETERPGHATEIVRNAWATGFRRFIAVGGDGTTFEILNGLYPLEDPAIRPLIGFLPLGTGNSFLRDFTDQGADGAIQAILEEKRRPCDVIRLEHTEGVLHFLNIFSLGFVAEVGAVRIRRFKSWGSFGYTAGVLVKLATLSQRVFPMHLDDIEPCIDPVTFISVNNSKYTGGDMMMAPEADTNDGLMDLVIVDKLGRIGLLQTFPKIFKGTHIHHPAVTMSRAQHITFDLDGPVDVLVDGEIFHLQPTRLEVLPAALDVMA